MSDRASTSASPRACSGAMYAGVPMIAPVRVSRESSAEATPKSTSFASTGHSWPGRLPSKITFEGLMSRCTMPTPCV